MFRTAAEKLYLLCLADQMEAEGRYHQADAVYEALRLARASDLTSPFGGVFGDPNSPEAQDLVRQTGFIAKNGAGAGLNRARPEDAQWYGSYATNPTNAGGPERAIEGPQLRTNMTQAELVQEMESYLGRLMPILNQENEVTAERWRNWIASQAQLIPGGVNSPEYAYFVNQMNQALQGLQQQHQDVMQLARQNPAAAYQALMDPRRRQMFQQSGGF